MTSAAWQTTQMAVIREGPEGQAFCVIDGRKINMLYQAERKQFILFVENEGF